MSIMQQHDKVIAVLCSDIHLSLKPPRARRKEPEWLDAMVKPLREITAAAQRYDAPVLCAGDIFDYWRAEPELINFAMNWLPKMYAIPGQHDLPLHNIELQHKSAFWTMVLANVITPVFPGKPVSAENDMVIHGYPWGFPLEPFTKKSKKYHVALCHDYFWTDKHHYPGAAEENEAQARKDQIVGYHAVAFGDNHKGFITKVNGIEVMNCGTLMRRKIDEEQYEPQIGLLCASGQIISHKLNTTGESLLSAEDEMSGMQKYMRTHDMDDFLNGLQELQSRSFDFMEAMEYAMTNKKVDNHIREIILNALEKR